MYGYPYKTFSWIVLFSWLIHVVFLEIKHTGLKISFFFKWPRNLKAFPLQVCVQSWAQEKEIYAGVTCSATDLLYAEERD